MPKQYLFIFCLMLVLFVGCINPPSIPENVLPKEKMAAVLAEIHIQQAYVSRLNFSTSDSSQVAYHMLEKSIFKQFKVDTASYKRSFIFYTENPEYMADIYKEVIKNIEKKVADYKAKSPQGKPTM